MRVSLLRILVIVGVAAGAGAIHGWVGDMPWVPDVEAIKKKEDLHKWLRANRGLTLQEFVDRIKLGALVIDARPREAFEEGHLDTSAYTGSYPSLLNVPPDEIDDHIERLMRPEVFGRTIVVYCTSDTCDYGEELYAALEAYGFFDIWIYFPGWEGIVKEKLPTATGPDTWSGLDFEAEPNNAQPEDPDANDVSEADPAATETEP